MFGALLSEDLVDELFLTLSPLLAGGGADPTLTGRPGLPEPARADAALGARAREHAVPPLRAAADRGARVPRSRRDDRRPRTAALQTLGETRERTLALVAALDDDELAQVHSPLMSPLVWDLGHIAAFEDLWIGHRYGGRPLLREDLADIYDAFETPRAQRGELDMLAAASAPASTWPRSAQRTLEVLAERGVGDGRWPSSCCATSSSTPRRCCRPSSSPA